LYKHRAIRGIICGVREMNQFLGLGEVGDKTLGLLSLYIGRGEIS
jgi:hypothetical protein